MYSYEEKNYNSEYSEEQTEVKTRVKVSTKTQEKTQVNVKSTDVDVLVDTYISLHKKSEELGFKEINKELGNIKKHLQSVANIENPDLPVVFESSKGKIIFSTRSEDVEITNKAQLFADLISNFGEEAAFKCIKFQLGDLRKILSTKEIETYTEKQRGSRTMEVVVNDI